jgi:hypothetical protein
MHFTLLGAAVAYANNVVRGRWPEIEPMLLAAARNTDGEEDAAVDYAAEVIQGTWNELETIILQGICNPMVGVDYAHRIRDARWSDLETVLSEQPHSRSLYNAVSRYAADVVKERWDVAEAIILAPLTGLAEPWEKGLAVVRYAADVVKGRWEEGENLLTGCTYTMLMYADEAVKGRLPEDLHTAMAMHSFADNDHDVRQYMAKYG